MKKSFIAIFLFMMILGGCTDALEPPLDQINKFSGRWTIAFKDNTGQVIRQGTFSLQDNGNVCDRIQMSVISDSVYLQGVVTTEGSLSGIFSDSCGTGTSGNVSGSFTEILGIITGTGSWNDTLRTLGAIGTWEARRQ